MARVRVSCELGHTHVVLKCDVCRMAVDESPESPARYIAVWPVSHGESGRTDPFVLCGPSCIRACDSLDGC